MNSHHNPEHPRFCTPGRWKATLFKARIGSKWRFVPISREKAGKRIQFVGKNGGFTYCVVELNEAIARPRKWHHDHYKRTVRGARVIRCDKDGQPIPRARKMIPGVSGKSFMRRFKKELREEKQQGKAA